MPSKYHKYKHSIKYFLRREYKWTTKDINNWMYNNGSFMRINFKQNTTAHQTAILINSMKPQERKFDGN